MRRSVLLVVVVLALLLAFGGLAASHQTAAQQGESMPSPAFVISMNLYTLDSDGTPERLSELDYAFSPVYSPDGSQLLFSRFTPDIIEAVADSGGYWEGPQPVDFWLKDMTTGEETLWLGQPEGVTFEPAEDGSYMQVLRSEPVWAPYGGGMVAWSETVIVSDPNNYTETYRLMVYTPETDEVLEVATGFIPGMVYSAPHQVLWGEGGLLVPQFDVEDGQPYYQLDVFEGTGARIGSGQLRETDSTYLQMIQWATYDGEYEGQPVVAALLSDGSVSIFDPISGDVTNLPDHGLKQTHWNAQDKGLEVIMAGGSERVYWINGQRLLDEILDLRVSPDGAQAVATSVTGQLYLHNGDSLSLVQGTGYDNSRGVYGLDWGPQRYQVVTLP